MTDEDRPAPATEPAGGVRRAVIRFLLLGVVVAVGWGVFRYTPLSRYLDREVLFGLLEQLRLSWWSPLALIALYLVLSPLGAPVTPLIIAGGAVFGAFWGGLYNFVGCFAGAVVSYLLAKTLGRDLIVHLAGQERIDKVEALLEKHGFWTLVRIRFIPVPSPIVNFGSALAGVKFRTFLAASALGLLPAILIYTYFVATLLDTATGPSREDIRNLVLSLGLMLTLSLLPTLWKWSQKRRRQRLLAAAESRDRI